jgi:hypothetical protein
VIALNAGPHLPLRPERGRRSRAALRQPPALRRRGLPRESIADATRKRPIAQSAHLPGSRRRRTAWTRTSRGRRVPPRGIGRHPMPPPGLPPRPGAGTARRPPTSTAAASSRTSCCWTRTRAVGALYVSDEWKAARTLALQPGFRMQFSDTYDPVGLFSGALVWNVFAKMFLKLNYAEGFRPPELQATRINALAVSQRRVSSPTPTSRSSARALPRPRSTRSSPRTLRRLERMYLRGDYAYTVLSDLVRNVSAAVRQLRSAGHPRRRGPRAGRLRRRSRTLVRRRVQPGGGLGARPDPQLPQLGGHRRGPRPLVQRPPGAVNPGHPHRRPGRPQPRRRHRRAAHPRLHRGQRHRRRGGEGGSGAAPAAGRAACCTCGKTASSSRASSTTPSISAGSSPTSSLKIGCSSAGNRARA